MTAAAESDRIIRTLVRHGVKFVICGGAACMLHGMRGRITADIDIRVELSDENLMRFVAAARDLKFQPRIPEPLEAIANAARREAWRTQKNAVVSTYSSPEMTVQLDVFLDYPIGFEELAEHADRMGHGDTMFLVSSKEDLIQAKQQVKPMRKIDQRDIADLQEMIERERRAKS